MMKMSFLLLPFPKNLDWRRFWTLCRDIQSPATSLRHGLTYQMHPKLRVLSSTTDGFLFSMMRSKNLRFNLDTANQLSMKEDLSLLSEGGQFIDYISPVRQPRSRS